MIINQLVWCRLQQFRKHAKKCSNDYNQSNNYIGFLVIDSFFSHYLNVEGQIYRVEQWKEDRCIEKDKKNKKKRMLPVSPHLPSIHRCTHRVCWVCLGIALSPRGVPIPPASHLPLHCCHLPSCPLRSREGGAGKYFTNRPLFSERTQGVICTDRLHS